MSEHEPKPVAYAAFAENGNIRIWSQEPGRFDSAAAVDWFQVQPLYPASDITALQEEVSAAEARANAAEQRLKEAVRLIERLAPLEQSKSWLTLPQYAAGRAFIKEAGE